MSTKLEQLLAHNVIIGEDGKYMCGFPDCGRHFCNRTFLLRHLNRIHGQEPPEQDLCPVEGCPNSSAGRGYADKGGLIIHMWKKHAALGYTRKEKKHVKRDLVSNQNNEASERNSEGASQADHESPVGDSKNLGSPFLAANIQPEHHPPEGNIQYVANNMQIGNLVLRNQDLLRNPRDPVPFAVSLFEIEGSDKDYASTGDETDWEDCGEAGSRSNCNTLEQGSTSWQERLTDAKTSMIDRLMEEFWTIYNQNWDANVTKYQGGSSQTAECTPSGLNISQSTKRLQGTKRTRDSPGGDDNDEDSGRRRKRPRPGSQSPKIGSESLKFACPYRKHNPRKYNIQDWKPCATVPHETVARMKAHLYTYHTIHRCLRCKFIFKTKAELSHHVQQDTNGCQVRIGELVDGINKETEDSLRCRKKAFKGQTEEERWSQVYGILFPSYQGRTPSPYFEPIRDGEEEARTNTPGSGDLADCEQYLRLEIPRLLRTSLERDINAEVHPIEERLMSQMVDRIREVQDIAFSNYRARFNLDFNNAATTSYQEQLSLNKPGVPYELAELNNFQPAPPNGALASSRLSAFFEAPPPQQGNSVELNNMAEYTTIRRISDNNLSDSGYASNITGPVGSCAMTLSGSIANPTMSSSSRPVAAQNSFNLPITAASEHSAAQMQRFPTPSIQHMEPAMRSPRDFVNVPTAVEYNYNAQYYDAEPSGMNFGPQSLHAPNQRAALSPFNPRVAESPGHLQTRTQQGYLNGAPMYHDTSFNSTFSLQGSQLPSQNPVNWTAAGAQTMTTDFAIHVPRNAERRLYEHLSGQHASRMHAAAPRGHFEPSSHTYTDPMNDVSLLPASLSATNGGSFMEVFGVDGFFGCEDDLAVYKKANTR